MTNQEKQEIIDAVLEAISQSTLTIEQLTAASAVSDADSFELSGGRKVTFETILEAIRGVFATVAALDNLRIDEAAKNRLQDAAIATNTANIVSNTAQILQNTGQAVFLGIPTIDLTAKTITFPSEGVVLYNVGRATAYTLQTTQVVNLGNDWMWKTIVWNDTNKVFEAANGSELRNLAEGQYEYAIIRSIPEWGVLRINSWRYVVDGTEYRQDMPSALPTTVASHGTALESLTQAMTGVQADVTGVQADVAAVRKLPMTTGTDTMAVGEEVAFMSDDERETYAKITPEGIFGKAFFTIDGERVATKNRSIKVLCFGNSFTEDSMSYVPAMLKNVAPELDFVIGMAVIGGSSLAQHCANFTGEAQTLDGKTVAVKNAYEYSKFSHRDSSWTAYTGTNEKSVDYMLADEDWDVVTFQQNGAAAYKDWATYFAPFIYKLHKALYDKAGVNGKTVKIGWLLTQGAYAADSSVLLNHWQGTATNSQKVLDETATEVVFPFGTAVQNLRTTSLAAAGVGGQYADFRADSTGHLHEGIGTMTANYCNLLAVLKLAGFENVSIIGEPTRVTIAWNTANGTRNPNYKDRDTTAEPTVYGVTDANVYAAQVAAIMAMKKPYEVTDCSAFVGSQS